MRLIEVPNNLFIDADHISMIHLKDIGHSQMEVKIFLKDRTSLETFYAGRKEMLKFVGGYKIATIYAAPAFEGRPE